jgi:hypothetical protein
MADFLLDDGSGIALVRGHGSEFRVIWLKRLRPRRIDTPTLEMRTILKHSGVDVPGLFARPRLFAHEHLLLPGDTVDVYGDAALDIVPEHSDRDYRSPSHMLTVTAPEPWHLLVVPVKKRRR